jgi:hypothetical protein
MTKKTLTMKDECSIIFSFLSPNDLLSIEQTSKSFLEIINEYNLWSRLFDAMFGSKLLYIGDQVTYSVESKRIHLVLFNTMFSLGDKEDVYHKNCEFVEDAITIEYYPAQQKSFRAQVLDQEFIDRVPIDPKDYIILRGEDLVKLNPLDETNDDPFDLIVDTENYIIHILFDNSSRLFIGSYKDVKYYCEQGFY